ENLVPQFSLAFTETSMHAQPGCLECRLVPAQLVRRAGGMASGTHRAMPHEGVVAVDTRQIEQCGADGELAGNGGARPRSQAPVPPGTRSRPVSSAASSPRSW